MTKATDIGDRPFPCISGYRITEALYKGSKTAVYRAVETASQQSVIVKTLQSAYPSFGDLVQFRHQYTIAKDLSIPGIYRPLRLISWQNSDALVIEDFGGISLQQYARKNELSLIETLAIALQMSDILNDLHQHHIIHKDIKPANIVIEPNSGRIQLIDFSIATVLSRETQGLQNPTGLEGTLAYLSPEQTGRMNRGIDYRTDFYGLGVTLYELLTGRLPFQSADPMALVHCHIARSPTAPHDIKPDLPPILSAIVLKLMAKNAEDRYQSALGLKHDLAHCLKEWKETQAITLFVLGSQDVSDRFLIPEKLYGRQLEVKVLLDAFERISQQPDSPRNRTAEMMLVAGQSGIGKTAVINEVHKPITRQRGYFLSGKFDQFNRSIPLSAFVQALQILVSQLLSESDQQLAEWRSKIMQAVGENGQVLIDVIPGLEQIIGPQPPALELLGTAAQTRFNRLFQTFTALFATLEHPLVMFLDDLQWADTASLQLIEQLMEDTPHLLMLGAYRDNEVSMAHPFMLTVEALKAAGTTANTVTLAPLTLREVDQLVADTLHCERVRSQPLSELILRKTQGNPFFTTQFLKALHEGGSIRFSPAQGQWECDLAQVSALSFSEDAATFMAQQLQKLPQPTQHILQLAACIGSQFDLSTLAIISKQSMVQANKALWAAMEDGLVAAHGNKDSDKDITYRFSHDRIQQAAYSLIPDEQKQATHYNIGQLLLSTLSSAEQEDRIFELTNQLNHGISLIAEQPERDALALLNLSACCKARVAIAYQAGQAYAKIGLQLLGSHAWQRQYDSALALHNLATELASFCGDTESMAHSFAAVVANTKRPIEQISVYRIKTRAQTSQNKLAEAIATGREILARLDISLPQVPTPQDIQQAIAEVDDLIGSRSIESLVDLPDMTDEAQIATMDMVMDVSPAAYLSGSPLYPLLIALTVARSVQYGNTERSSHSYAAYGMMVCHLSKAVSTGVAYGNLSQQLVFKHKIKISKPETLVVVGMFLAHRDAHIKTTLPILKEAYTSAVEVGNLACMGYAAAAFCSSAFWCAQPLPDLIKEIAAYAHELEKFKQLTTANWCYVYQQSALNLLRSTNQPTDQPYALSGEIFVEADLLSRLHSGQDLVALHFFHLNKLMLSYLFEAYEVAQVQAAEVRKYLAVVPGMVEEAVFYFYDSLSAIASLDTSNTTADPTVLAQIEQNEAQLTQHWASHAPMNHQHKVDLIAAEKCRVLGKKAEAIDHYDSAIAAAKDNNYAQEGALANELAAKFYLRWGKAKVAAGYMQEAYYGYARWGAQAKVAHLEQTYPQLLQALTQQTSPMLTATGTVSLTAMSSVHGTGVTETAWLDLPAVMKAAQAISQEIGLERLLTTLMQIVVANAGAQTGHFILQQDNHWRVMAQAEPEQLNALNVRLDDYLDIPHSVIYSVARSQETSVFENLSEATQFSGDRYVAVRQPKSALCLPVSRQGKLVGILYLENNLTVGAFTHDRVEILQLLASQAAISLENARLYQQTENYSQTLEAEVARKTQALNQKAQDLEDALTDLKKTQAQLIQTAKMSSLGQMVAGVAHEINNPINFIQGNLSYTKRTLDELLELLALYDEKYPQPDEEIQEMREDLEIDFLVEDAYKVLKSMTTGSERIKQIVLGLRNFSRLDESGIKSVDLHSGIESALLILNNRLQAGDHQRTVNIVKSYGDLPQITCEPSQINQVFLNILNNAVDAIQESPQPEQIPKIHIRTEALSEGSVSIAIANNGSPIPPEIQDRVFEPFFTTKPVGQGTGLGLFVSYSIVEQHQGSLAVKSQVGEPTEFVITLPVEAKSLA